MEMIDIKDVLDVVIRLGYRNKVMELVLNLYLTLTGFKTSFLWDIGRVPGPKQLLQLGSMLGCDLVIVRVNGDIVIGLRSSIEALAWGLEKEPPVFVDISEDKKPSVIKPTNDEMKRFKTIIMSIVTIKEDIVEVGVEEEDNVPCLYGLLLGFPLIYVFKGKEGNCLGGTELTVIRLETSWSDHSCSPVSFSVPSALWRETEVECRVRSWWSGLSGGLSWEQDLMVGDVRVRVNTETRNLPVVVL